MSLNSIIPSEPQPSPYAVILNEAK